MALGRYAGIGPPSLNIFSFKNILDYDMILI